jgi:hypothetical protein
MCFVYEIVAEVVALLPANLWASRRTWAFQTTTRSAAIWRQVKVSGHRAAVRN